MAIIDMSKMSTTVSVVFVHEAMIIDISMFVYGKFFEYIVTRSLHEQVVCTLSC